MKEEIIKILSEKENPSLTIEELKNFINEKGLEETLASMVEDGEIDYSKKKGKYLLFENSHLKKGQFMMNEKGFGFVRIQGLPKDVYINKKDVNDARNNDMVAIEIDKRTGEGKVVRIIKRDATPLIGEVYHLDGKCYVKPDNKKNRKDIFVPKEFDQDAVDGHKVVVELTNEYTGKIKQIIGHKNDVGIDILSFVYEYGFAPKFPDEVLQTVDALPMEVLSKDLEGRKDLRDVEIFTIDGDDTKDIDDAISLEKLPNGNFKLGVHIADVSNYVIKGQPIDIEAFERGTSVYLVDRVLPMLPQKLSNGICSLNPNVDRLALSCVMEIDNNGNAVKNEIFESVIRSRKQMTYNCVNSILEDNVVPEGYESFENTLRLMKELSDILRRKMVKRGYIEFNTVEAKIIVDENCHPTEIKLREQKTGENLIENFMIAANETVASSIFYRNLPGIYRVHDKPDQIRWQNFLNFINSRGYVVTGKTSKKMNATDLQSILNQLKDKPESMILNDLAIRSQAKAVYSNENIGHFGLGSTCYAHFTSPIRRYPDLTLHRLVKDYAKNYSDNVIETWNADLPNICLHSSEKERDADECERSVEKMKKAEYMEEHIGEVYQGVISGLSNFGMFVELPNTVEGLIKLEDLGDDYYIYDERTYGIYGKRTGKKFMFGDQLTVKVLAASKVNSTVDFELVRGVKDESINN